MKVSTRRPLTETNEKGKEAASQKTKKNPSKREPDSL